MKLLNSSDIEVGNSFTCQRKAPDCSVFDPDCSSDNTRNGQESIPEI